MNTLFSTKKNIVKALVLLTVFSILFSSLTKRTEANLGASAVGIAAGCFAGSLANQAANAMSVPVADSPTEDATTGEVTKDCILDGIANLGKEKVIEEIEKSTYDWINTGFNGKPSYGADLEQLFKSTKDRVIDELIYNDTNLQGLCTGFEFPIKFALQTHFYADIHTSSSNSYNTYEPKCTLDDIKDNIDDAGNNIYSWDNFLSVTTNADNNAFGSYFNIISNAEEKILEANAKIQLDYEVNSGFISYRKCSTDYIEARQKQGKSTTYDSADPTAGQGCPVTTPGISIFEKLTETLGTEIDQIVAADEFDEMIATVVEYYVTEALTDGDEGVRGFTDSNSYQDGLDAALEDNKAALDDYKDTLVGQFDERVYEIAIKIVESKLKTIQGVVSDGRSLQSKTGGAVGYYNKANACWSTKDGILNSGFQLFATAGADGYIELTKSTTSGALSFLSPLASKIASDIKRAEDDIAYLETQREKAIEIQDAIADITSADDLSDIAFSSGLEPVDIAEQLSLRDVSNEYYDELVNGEFQGYKANGDKIINGGFVTSNNYCSQFNIQQDPEKEETEDYTPKTGEPSIGNVNSLTATGNVVIIDFYDPSSDLQDLKDNPKEPEVELAKSCSVQVTGSSKKIDLDDGASLTLGGYVNKSNSCASENVRFTCNDGSLSNNFSGSSATFFTDKASCDATLTSVVVVNTNEVRTFIAKNVTKNSATFEASFKHSGISHPKIFFRYGTSASNLNLTSSQYRPDSPGVAGTFYTASVDVEDLTLGKTYFVKAFMEDNANFVIKNENILAEGESKTFTTPEGDYENPENLNAAQLQTREKLISAHIFLGTSEDKFDGIRGVGGITSAGGYMHIETETNGNLKITRNIYPIVKRGNDYVLGNPGELRASIPVDEGIAFLEDYLEINDASGKDLTSTQWLTRRALIDAGIITKNKVLKAHSVNPKIKYMYVNVPGDSSVGIYLRAGSTSSTFYAYDRGNHPYMWNSSTGKWFFDETKTQGTGSTNRLMLSDLQEHITGNNDGKFTENTAQDSVLQKLVESGIVQQNAWSVGIKKGEYVYYSTKNSRIIIMDNNANIYYVSTSVKYYKPTSGTYTNGVLWKRMSAIYPYTGGEGIETITVDVLIDHLTFND